MAQKQRPDYSSIRKDLAGYGDDQLIGPVELAALLSTTVNMVYRYNYVSPKALPPRLTNFGRKLAWRLGTCRDWLRGLGQPGETPSPERAAQRRLGRPRSTDPK